MPNRTVVAAIAAARWPVAALITQCPVTRVPLRPDISRQRATASATEAGLPSARPSRSSSESQPITSPPASPAATAAALAWASRPASSAGEAAENAVSSTPLTMTSGSSPAARSTASLAGEAEARTMAVTPRPYGIRRALTVIPRTTPNAISQH